MNIYDRFAGQTCMYAAVVIAAMLFTVSTSHNGCYAMKNPVIQYNAMQYSGRPRACAVRL